MKQYCREKGAIPDVAVKLWINALHPVRLDGNVALFTVQSSFQRDVILGNYGDLLKEAFLNTLGLAVDIQIQVVDEEDQEVQEKFKTNDETRSHAATRSWSIPLRVQTMNTHSIPLS